MKISFSSDDKSLYILYTIGDSYTKKSDLYQYDISSEKTVKSVSKDICFGDVKFDYQNKYYSTFEDIRKISDDDTLFSYDDNFYLKMNAIGFSHNGKLMTYLYSKLFVGEDDYIVIRDIESKKILKKIKPEALGMDYKMIYSVTLNMAFLPDDKSILFSFGNKIYILNSNDLKIEHSFSVEGYISSLCLSQDGKYIIGCSVNERAYYDNGYQLDVANIYIWDVACAKLIGKKSFNAAESFNHVFLSSDSRYFLTVSGSTLKYWDFISIIYSSQIALEINRDQELFKPKDEFETQDQYKQRQNKADDFKNQMIEKYHQIYLTDIENVKIKQELELALKNQKIQNSYIKVDLKITSLGTYNSDRQFFPVTIGNMKENLYIPIAEAKSFKENLALVTVKADKQLLADATTWDVFNIRVIHPVTGFEYLLRKKDPYFLNENALSNVSAAATGIPKLIAKVKFIDPSGNDLLDGNETAKFEVKVENSGDGIAQNVTINLSSNETVRGVTFEKTKSFTGIAPHQSQTATFDVTADRTVSKCEIPFKFDFTEAKGFKPGSINYTINTQSFKAPSLVLQDVGIKEITGNENNIIENGETIEVTVLLQNVGQGIAEEVLAVVIVADPNIVSLTPTKMKQSMGTLQPGESRTITFKFSVNYDYNGADLLPVSLVLSEKYKSYGTTSPLGLEMKKINLATARIKVDGKYSNDLTIKDASLTSDVDKNISSNAVKYPNRFALIIGNEDYTSRQVGLETESNVEFAVNDAKMFRQYAISTLGMDERNVITLFNSTAGEMSQKIDLVARIMTRLGENGELFFFYAGHGLPDETTKVPYLIPVDVTASNLSSAIKLSSLYDKLAQTKAKRITFFLDACFTGGGREAGLLASRGVKIKPKEETITGNIIVFSSSSGEQSSLAYKEKAHGMFTYYLLKKIQETKGNVSYSELDKYLRENISLESLRVNGKSQDPTVYVSSDIRGVWETLMLY